MTDRITDEMVEAVARAMAYDDNTYDPDDVIDLVPGAVVNGKTDEVIFWEMFASKARAALSAVLPLMDWWQPIKTAPKDGTRIVLIDGLKGVKAVGSWLQYGFSEEKKFGWYPFENPRFWLPLPPAPKGDE
jgi:hypothetical protein